MNKLQQKQSTPISKAACRSMPAPQIFFSDKAEDIAEAKSICARCTIQVECLSGAWLRNEQYGVWGGQLFFKGKIVTQRRKRGRPSKDAQTAKLELPADLPSELRAEIMA